MCGIYGCVNLAGDALRAPAEVLAMEKALRHRGPDTGGHLDAPDAILGSRRLSIMDLGAEANQPFASPDGNVWIVCNGEIYNAPELRRHYAAQGYPFRTDHNDVEPILPLYLEHGDAAIARLDGMFGLAIWDQRTRRLLLARDRTGEKPLYYSDYQGELQFASEIQALLIRRPARPALSTAGLSDYLTLGYCLPPNTMFEGIAKLRAGHLLTADRDGLRTRPYWDPADHVTPASESPAREIRDTFAHAVERQVAADVPVGVFLSGGLDSSFLAAETVRHFPAGSVNTYAASFSAASYDESDWAARVARKLGTNHHPVPATSQELLRALETVVTRLAEPSADPAILPVLLLSEAASRDVRVVLSGEGADELFGGYPTYLGHRAAQRFGRLPGLLRSAIAATARRLPVTRRKVSIGFLARRFVEEAYRDPLQRHIAWFGALGPNAVDTAVHYRPPRTQSYWTTGDDISDPVKSAMVFDLQTYLPENLLVKLDRATMLTSMEARAPFLDRQVLELALRQPAHTAVSTLSTKMALKRAAEDLLPKEVIYRRKRGLSVPVSDWINNELRADFDDLFDPARLRQQDLLRPEPVLALLREHRTGRGDHGRKLWPLYMLQRWHRQWCED